jgi:hypothetical protein
MMPRAKAARKDANPLTMMERMQRAADRIKDARKEMRELEVMMEAARYVVKDRYDDGVRCTMVKDALCVRETLSDGLQALQRMMDGDERNEYERRGDNLAAAGDFMFRAVGQLQHATELFADCCDEDGYACDDVRVPNMEEISQMTQTARVWGKMLGRMQWDADRIEEADRYDDQMDKTTEAYEEMAQIELEYEMHAANNGVEDTHAQIEQLDYEQHEPWELEYEMHAANNGVEDTHAQIEQLDYEIDQIEQMQEMEQKLNEENGSYAMTRSEAANMEAYEEMFQYERQHHCTN